jgi:asparagine synthase (glutamine-hydrolysing)
VARQISRALGLEHRVVELAPGDYLRHAREIVAATSGVKTAAHWHTDLYVRAAGLGADTPHYVGSNGEFARTFFFDAGTLARAVDRGPARLLEAYLAAKLVRRARRFPASLLAGGPNALACARHAAASVGRFTGRFLDAMDGFYATERVRHFIGNGLALYAQHGAPRSPFLDARFLRAAARLPRADRLGGNFHRRAIAASWEPLLAFPVGAEEVMARRAPPLYSLRRPKVVGYSPLGDVLKSAETRELIVEASGLDELIGRADRIDAADNYPAAVEVLLTLAVAADLGAEAARGT